MFRYKSNKQAVIIAAMIILLCLMSLVSATMALFTVRIDDGAIGIITTAGYIDVDIVDTTAKENSLVGEYLQFQTYAEKKEIIFEPGATYHTQGFKIKNDGDITISFRLSVSDTIKTDKDVKIDIEEFYQYFDMWLSTDPNSMDQACDVRQFVSVLGPESITEDTYYLFIRMKENVGNTFQDKSYNGIGVTVFAVQSNIDITDIN